MVLFLAHSINVPTTSAVEWTNITCLDIDTIPGTLLKERFWAQDGTPHNFTQNDSCQFGCTDSFGFGICKVSPFQPVPMPIYVVFEIFGITLLLLTITLSRTNQQKLVYPALSFIVFSVLVFLSFSVGDLNTASNSVIISGVYLNLTMALVSMIYVFGMAFGFIKEEVEEHGVR